MTFGRAPPGARYLGNRKQAYFLGEGLHDLLVSFRQFAECRLLDHDPCHGR